MYGLSALEVYRDEGNGDGGADAMGRPDFDFTFYSGLDAVQFKLSDE